MQEKLFNQLINAGCDVSGALDRVLGDKELYCALLKVVLNMTVDDISQIVKKGDAKAAFDCAHNKKGETGNLGLTPVYVPICQMTEIFRSGKTDGAEEYIRRADAAIKELKKIIKDNE